MTFKHLKDKDNEYQGRFCLGTSTHWGGKKLMKWQTRLRKQPNKMKVLDYILLLVGRKELQTILNRKTKGKVATAMEERKEREVPPHK